jgi:hypothetical protein
MVLTFIKAIFFLSIVSISSIGYACESIVSTIKISGSPEIEDFKWELTIAEIPYLIEENALVSTFVWMKIYDAKVKVLKNTSYERNQLGIAKLLLDIGNSDKGLKLLNNEISKGNSDANVLMGLIYRKGNHAPLSPKKAFKEFSKASEANNPDGLFYLGRCYELGIGVKTDCNTAVKLFKKAADLNSKMAKLRLSDYYKIGACGINKDINKSNKLIEEIQQ